MTGDHCVIWASAEPDHGPASRHAPTRVEVRLQVVRIALRKKRDAEFAPPMDA